MAAAALFVLSTACSSDLMGPSPADLTLDGTWQYVASDLSGSVFGEDVDCVYGFQMTLEVTGVSFDGEYRNALMTCMLFGESQVVDGGGGDIVSGSRSGTAVQFDVDTERIRNTGVLSAGLMSGDVTIELIVQRDALIDTIIVSGPWSASR